MSKVQPRTLPLAYRLPVEVKFRGGGKSADVRKVCVPEEGGGEGTKGYRRTNDQKERKKEDLARYQ